jgi:hypothetical protein
MDVKSIEWLIESAITGDLDYTIPHHATKVLMARAELRAIQNQKGILVCTKEHAWDVPYTEGALKELLKAAEENLLTEEAIKRLIVYHKGLQLMPIYLFEAKYYSHVVLFK